MADTMHHPHASRRGHNPQISISDADHHVTEAIGGMYDTDEEESIPARHDRRPLSYIVSPKESYINQAHVSSNLVDPKTQQNQQRPPLAHTIANDRAPRVHGSIGKSSLVGTENGSPISPPTLSRQNSADTAVQQFPLNDIDYESSPAAVAQELSNLQAIRRMSMSVDTADPDLPAFSVMNKPPSPNADENDASRLFWVPARLHPELAPTEFKTFIEERVDKIKRRSGDGQTPFPEIDRSCSSGITRKKSMLSRQVDPVRTMDDTPPSLERNATLTSDLGDANHVDLATLASLVSDPSNLRRTLSIGDGRRSQDSAIDVPLTDDVPKLALSGLKRSTRTNYRKGSLRKGERVPSARRVAERERDSERGSVSGPDSPPQPEDLQSGTSRAQIEPVASQLSTSIEAAENFSRPGLSRRQGLGISTSAEDPNCEPLLEQIAKPLREMQQPETHNGGPFSAPPSFKSRIARDGRTTAQLPGDHAPVPEIIETPPSEERPEPGNHVYPQRGSSRQPPPAFSSPRPTPLINGARTRPSQDERDRPDATLNDLSSRPRILPGSGNMRTDDLTLVPTFETVKKVDKKETSRKPSWGWFLGGEDEKKEKKEERKREEKRAREARAKEEALERENEKQRQKEKEKERAQSRKPKVSSRLAPPETARLDVLQTSIDGAQSRGRESLVLDRDSIKLEQARKETTRKSSDGTGKKEKDGSILSAIFGGAKRSKDEHSNKKRSTSRGLSPEPPPPPRLMRPDIDYNWTRFSILEERAIYRLAHIKLANPKRALHSQVLLSNFMYSYLAKVQLMHPQIQVGGVGQQQQHQAAGAAAAASPQVSTGQSDAKPDEFLQYQRWQEQQGNTKGSRAAETGTLSNGHNTPIDAYSMNNHNVKPVQGHYPPQYANGSYGESLGYGGGDRDVYQSYSQQQQQQQQQQHEAQGQHVPQSHGGHGGHGMQRGYQHPQQQHQHRQPTLYNTNSWGEEDNIFQGL